MNTSPYTHPSMPGTPYLGSRGYLTALPREMTPDMFFIPADAEPPTALPPILVTVQEEVTLARGPRKPIIHWEDVPETSMNTALESILRQALELRAVGIEPVFTMNGKVVDLNGPIDPHNL